VAAEPARSGTDLATATFLVNPARANIWRSVSAPREEEVVQVTRAEDAQVGQGTDRLIWGSRMGPGGAGELSRDYKQRMIPIHEETETVPSVWVAR